MNWDMAAWAAASDLYCQMVMDSETSWETAYPTAPYVSAFGSVMFFFVIVGQTSGRRAEAASPREFVK